MQYSKVEICGVNTADIRVLSEKEKKRLLHIVKHGETERERSEARQELIEGNLKLVLSVVQKFSNRGENPDDLFQVGCIGLMKAIDNFDDTLDVRFSTYGVPMIIGAASLSHYREDNAQPGVGTGSHEWGETGPDKRTT